MTDAGAVELLPCPFCGGTNLKTGGDDKVVVVWCQTCETSGPNHYSRAAEWNTRAALPLLGAVRPTREAMINVGALALLQARISPPPTELRNSLDTKHAKADAARVIDAILALLAPADDREAGGWKPIESAPKDGTLVLILYDDNIEIAGWGGHDEHVGWVTRHDDSSPETDYLVMVDNPTHWHRLPAAPRADKAAMPQEERDGGGA